MRRIAAMLALLLWALVTSPAAAHRCAIPVEVPVGEPTRITLGITAEQAAVTSVEIGIPDGFELERVAAADWEVEQTPRQVTLTGGEVARFACGYVGLAGTAAREGVLVFPLTVHAEDGSTMVFSGSDLGHHLSGQLVYAGIPIATATAGDSSPPSLLELAGWALMAAAAVAGLAAAARRVRRR